MRPTILLVLDVAQVLESRPADGSEGSTGRSSHCEGGHLYIDDLEISRSIEEC